MHWDKIYITMKTLFSSSLWLFVFKYVIVNFL